MGRLEVINAALRRERGDPAAKLFGFDQAGRLYVNETTHRNIAALWSHLLAGDGMHQGEPVTMGAGHPANDPNGDLPLPAAGSDAKLDETLSAPL